MKNYPFLDASGEMATLTRMFDWSSTSIGPVDQWSPSLKTAVGILLHSGFPMFLWWGKDMVQFYNDAYRPSLGENGKHPTALGATAKETWPEIWDTISPLINSVKTTGESFFLEDQLIPIYRNEQLEDVYWTFSYSAVHGDEGNIDGVLVVCHETTNKVETITRLQTTQGALAQSETNMRNMIEKAPVAISILKGPDHVVEIANDRMFTLWGKSRDEMINQPVFNGLVDAGKEGFRELLDSVYQSGLTYTAFAAPVTLYRESGPELAYVNFVYEAYREGNDTIAGVIVVANEVTKEVIARQKLEESEHKIRSLVESTPFPIGVYEGPDMKISILNQAIIDVWGKGNQDFSGKTYMEVLPELEEQDIYPQLTNVYKTGTPFHARDQRVDLVVNGELQTFYFHYSFTPLFDSSGKTYGIMNTAADVTDLNIAKLRLEQSERNIREMVKQAPVAMCILLGRDHVVEIASDKMLELWGKPIASVMQQPIFTGLPDARNQGLEDLLDSVYKTGVAIIANERPVNLLRNGKPETVYQNFVYEPYRDSNGNIIGVFAITIDVTPQVLARQQIEAIVKERTQSLEQKNAELSQFAYIASHDLQEPARKISTFIEALERSLGDTIDPRSKSFVSKIERASSRMLALIKDVLTISQLSNQQDKSEPVNLQTILNDVLADYELSIENKNATIVLEADLPTIHAIPVQMSQLFSNLVSNALKFAKENEPLVLKIESRLLNNADLPAHKLTTGNDYLKIKFTDNGVGFSPEYSQQIFNIFQRLHGRSEYEGTGIGLAICKKIVENHKGRIFAESEPGAGTVFTILLPV